jgi:tetratricopeptide (TPR) repeat protein
VRRARRLLTGLALVLSGCTFSLDWIREYRAERAIEHQDFASALKILSDIMQSDPDSPRSLSAARLGARVAQFHAKNYGQAVDFYKHVVMRSPEVEERKSAQRYIAQIYFENLQDFNQAVFEYEKLLRLDLTPEESFRYRLNLAKSHLRLNNIDQAVIEVDSLLSQKHSADEIFEARIFKANSLVAAKRLSEAAQMWEAILKEFPEKSQKENVAMNLVVCYEEMKDFNRAIEVLERMREGYAHPDFLDLRIRRLRERMGNQPGGQGGLKR